MGGLRTRKNTNMKVKFTFLIIKEKNTNQLFKCKFSKVVLGLLMPPFITKLDFKSREELQSMPQTEEEHLENQYLDYEDKDKQHPDAEVMTSIKIQLSYNFIH